MTIVELPNEENRLVIQNIELFNFKSYAGKWIPFQQYSLGSVIIGPFHPSFSSIVGPNGSG